MVEATDDLKVWKQVRMLQADSKSTLFTPEPELKVINHYFRLRVK